MTLAYICSSCRRISYLIIKTAFICRFNSYTYHHKSSTQLIIDLNEIKSTNVCCYLYRLTLHTSFCVFVELLIMLAAYSQHLNINYYPTIFTNVVFVASLHPFHMVKWTSLFLDLAKKANFRHSPRPGLGGVVIGDAVVVRGWLCCFPYTTLHNY